MNRRDFLTEQFSDVKNVCRTDETIYPAQFTNYDMGLFYPPWFLL